MISGSLVIAGAGHAGTQLALMLRQIGYDEPITLVGEEASAPYQRPPLSKTYLKEGDANRLLFRKPAVFTDQRIDLRLGSRVTSIGRDRRVAELDNDTEIAWEHFVLAVGTRVARPPIPGLDLPGIHSVRTLDDARNLRQHLTGASRVAIIGGGFIGLELAAEILAIGAAVWVFESGHRVMARAVSPTISELLKNFHEQRGVHFICDAFITSIEAGAGGCATTIHYGKDQRLGFDAIVLAAGVVPNVELASMAGLTVSNGIHVDGYMTTDDANIYAIGDCAAFPDPHTSRRIRLESVQTATDHARCLAAVLTDRPRRYESLPWFWSDQGGRKLQIVGLAQPGDEEVHRTDGSGEIVFRVRAGDLVAVETLDLPGAHIAARRLLASGPVRFELLKEFAFDLKACASTLPSR